MNGEGEKRIQALLVAKLLEWNRYPRNYGSLQEKAGGKEAGTASDNKSPGK